MGSSPKAALSEFCLYPSMDFPPFADIERCVSFFKAGSKTPRLVLCRHRILNHRPRNQHHHPCAAATTAEAFTMICDGLRLLSHISSVFSCRSLLLTRLSFTSVDATYTVGPVLPFCVPSKMPSVPQFARPVDFQRSHSRLQSK